MLVFLLLMLLLTLMLLPDKEDCASRERDPDRDYDHASG